MTVTQTEDALIALLDGIRPYSFADTSEVRVSEGEDGGREGWIPLADHAQHAGDAIRKAEEIARDSGWATRRGEVDGRKAIHIREGEGVDPELDSVRSLGARRRDRVDNAVPGARVRVSWGRAGHGGEGVGRIVTSDQVSEGDQVYVEYGERRRGSGFSYSTTDQSFQGEVTDREGDELVIGENRARIQVSDERHPGVEFPNRERQDWDRPYGVKVMVRLED